MLEVTVDGRRVGELELSLASPLLVANWVEKSAWHGNSHPKTMPPNLPHRHLTFGLKLAPFPQAAPSSP